MNLKLIDAAIAGYRPVLDDVTNARLAFFRQLWGAMDETAAACEGAVSFDMPCAADLRAFNERGESVLSQRPARVDAGALARTSAAVARAMAEHGGFEPSIVEALSSVEWLSVIESSALQLAGSDPKSYVSALQGGLAVQGLGEREASICASAASLALRAVLSPTASKIRQARVSAGADRPRPVHCPVCGCEAAVAHVGGGTSSGGRGRSLWCAQCGCVWEYERVRCARCGTQNQAHLHFYNVEGDDAHRIATCDECGGYIRTVYDEESPMAALRPFSFEVEDVVMARLDLIAFRQAQAQATGSPTPFDVEPAQPASDAR